MATVEGNNITAGLSRREATQAAFGGLLLATVAGRAQAAAGVILTDPIFVAIEAHKSAALAVVRHVAAMDDDTPTDDAYHAASDPMDAAGGELTKVMPTTMAGMLALLDYLEAFHRGAVEGMEWHTDEAVLPDSLTDESLRTAFDGPGAWLIRVLASPQCPGRSRVDGAGMSAERNLMRDRALADAYMALEADIGNALDQMRVVECLNESLIRPDAMAKKCLPAIYESSTVIINIKTMRGLRAHPPQRPHRSVERQVAQQPRSGEVEMRKLAQVSAPRLPMPEIDCEAAYKAGGIYALESLYEAFAGREPIKAVTARSQFWNWFAIFINSSPNVFLPETVVTDADYITSSVVIHNGPVKAVS